MTGRTPRPAMATDGRPAGTEPGLPGRTPERGGQPTEQSRARARPREDRSCDAAMTTRGRFALRPGATPSLRPGRRIRSVQRRVTLTTDLLSRPRPRSQRAAVTKTARAARHPRRRRLGQDPVLTHRIAWQSREARIEPAHTSSRSRSPARPRASCARRLARLGVRERSPPAPSTRSRSRSCAAGRRPGARCPRCSTARRACSGRSSGGAARPARWRRQVGVRDRVGQGPPRGPERYERRVACRPYSAAPVSEIAALRRATRRRSAAAASSTSTTSSGVRPRARRRRRVRRRAALALPPPLRRRVPGRQPGAAAARRAWSATRRLCVVGDPDQAIYGFAGADTGHSTTSPRDFPAERYRCGVRAAGYRCRRTPGWRPPPAPRRSPCAQACERRRPLSRSPR